MEREVKTVADMKVGDRLLLGAFAVRWNEIPRGDAPRISWLKATKGCDFISECVLMSGMYDVPTWNGGRRLQCESFRESNLCMFLNSEEDSWFRPAYDWDLHDPYSNMGQHSGFLKYFGDGELDALVSHGLTGSGYEYRIRIPTDDEVSRDGFQLFRRKGVRAHPSESYCSYYHISDSSYPSYWTMTQNEYDSRAIYIGSDSHRHLGILNASHGIRPACTIKHDAKVARIDANTYELIISNDAKISSNEELLEMLGLI